MAMGSAGLGTKIDYAGEDQQQFTGNPKTTTRLKLSSHNYITLLPVSPSLVSQHLSFCLQYFGRGGSNVCSLCIIEPFICG
jgi:hypothetical protein